MINYLIDDYKKIDGKLASKPYSIVLRLRMDSDNNDECYINKSSIIYNPFILGKLSTRYVNYRLGKKKKKKSGSMFRYSIRER